MVEDVFAAFRALAGYTRVLAVPNDLHGDAIFCEDEVDVVRSAGALLNVLDPCGIEQFCKLGFTWANMQPPLVARLRALATFFEAALASSASVVGSLDLMCALLGGHLVPPQNLLLRAATNGNAVLPEKHPYFGFGGYKTKRYELSADTPHRVPAIIQRDGGIFRWERIRGRHIKHFRGMAYDASTAVGLYNSGGFVVKNCHCGTTAWEQTQRRIPVSFSGGTEQMLTVEEIGRELGKVVLDELEGEIRTVLTG
jgi:hypothetical protein